MIEFIYFDLGNVLINFDHERACQQVAELGRLPVNLVRDTIFGGDLQDRYEAGKVTTTEFCREFNKRTGSSIACSELAHAASDIFWLNRPIWPLITSLRRSGQRIGILSNTCEAHWRFVSELRFPYVAPLFSELVLSYEVGVTKPDGSIYQVAAQRANVPPERIFFTDDKPENVAAAADAGWQAHPFVSPLETWRLLHQLNVEMA